MLTPEQIDEMMARVRKLELRARRLVRESFSGEYLSSFRGQGLDFDDFREYQHGDEVRFIDWNVTARMNTPYVRKFREERELSVILAIDLSHSTDYGSIHLSKREVAAEAAAVLGFSAIQNGDKVGLLLFANEPILFIPPQKGSRHLLRMIREILVTQANQPGTSISAATDHLIHSLRRKSLVFVISDFITDELQRPLAKLSQKHEIVALQIKDPIESQIPKAGHIHFIDAELGTEVSIQTNSAEVRENYKKAMELQQSTISQAFHKCGIDSAILTTDGDTLANLHQLLKSRSHKHSRS